MNSSVIITIIYVIGIIIGALGFGMWDAETSISKAMLALAWTIIFLIGISSVHSQDDVQELGIENTDIIASQSLVDALQNRIPGARKITDRYGNKNLVCLYY